MRNGTPSVLSSLIVLSLSGVIGCGTIHDIFAPPAGPSQVVTVVVNQTQGGLTPAGSPPAGGQNGACSGSPDRLNVGFYAFDHCPNPPANKGGELPLGCRGLATVTPKLAGTSDDDHRFDATTPSWRVVSGPVELITPGAEGNSFNAFLEWRAGTAVGSTATIEAAVCGKAAAFTFRATP